MSDSKPSQPNDTKFWITASFVMLATVSATTAAWPAAQAHIRRQAAQLVADGDQAAKAGESGNAEAKVDYQLAGWLDPHNTTAALRLATAQIAAGQPTAALDTLSRAGQGSDIARIRVKTLLELGRTTEAVQASAPLTAPNTSETDLTLAALALAADDRGDTIAPLMARVSSPEALQALARAQAGNLPLATQLYVSGLLQSSSTILVKLPVSYERNLLLAKIRYRQHTPTTLTEAANLLTTATTLLPSALEAHQLLAATYQAQSKTPEAAQQQSLINKLKTQQF